MATVDGETTLQITTLLLQLFFIVLLARTAAFAVEYIKIPAVIGEIAAGIIIGSTFLYDFLQLSLGLEFLELFAELGIIFLLFAVGLETRFSDLHRVGRTAILVAVLGVVIPFFAGYLLFVYTDQSTPEALFMGAALVATSVGITARVIRDMRLTDSVESKVIIGAAVIDDILGLIVLAVVSNVATGEGSLLDIALIAGLAVVFVLGVVLVGTKFLPVAFKNVPAASVTCSTTRSRPEVSPLALAVLVCFGLSALAAYVGLAAIIGAFLAGMTFAEFKEKWPCEQSFESINEFLAPFFFVFVGIQVSLASFGSVALIAVIVTVVALITKYVGCGLGAIKLGKKSASIVGIGMTPRGEVGIIVASIGLSVGALSQDLFSVIVAMSIATTIIAPPLLARAFRKAYPNGRDGQGTQ